MLHKRIALTGARGVVGAALLPALQNAGHKVLALSRANGFSLEHLGAETATRITDFKPDIFIHAAWAGTENTERNDPRFMHINIDGGVSLLEMAINAGCKHWIGFGSQAEYSPHISEPISETAAAEPAENYGIAKLQLLGKQQTICARAGIDFNWLRLFTCYSKHMPATYLIPYLIGTLAKGDLPLLKTPQAVWDMLHAEDAAAALLRVIEKPAGGIYNLASGKGISVGEIALTIAQALHFTRMTELENQLRANQTPATYRVADMQKFSHAFDWSPRISIAHGIALCLAD